MLALFAVSTSSKVATYIGMPGFFSFEYPIHTLSVPSLASKLQAKP